MSPAHVEKLLYELCVVLGFCLPPDAQIKLQNDPPTDADAFTDAVIRAEGLDPYADVPLHLLRDVKARVAKHFKEAEDAYFNQQSHETEGPR
jgi:hypothetical protein